jgi:adapter protein MecA 1/2
MKFSRVGKHTIRCIISEEEISDLGFTLEEIMSNGERTQEFMNQIFDIAEQRFETKFELGIKTVRADFMSDHTLSLTFSEHPGSDEMMEHLKDIVNGLINSIPQQKWEEMQDAKCLANGEGDVRVLITLVFSEMDILLRFVRQIPLAQLPPSALYRFKSDYMLLMNLSRLSEEEVKCLSVLTDEYAADIQVGAERMSYIEEHGEVILRENALEMLREL